MKKDSVITMVLVLTITCIIAGLCLSFTYMQTKDAIASAEREATLKSVRQVLPAFDGEPAEKTLVIDGLERRFYIGRRNNRIVGIATTSTALGYGGTLHILVGIDVKGSITGVVLLQHKETPGLGTKAANPDFLDQFKGKSLKHREDAIAVVNDGGDIQGVTSATITSRAVAKAGTKALRIFIENRNDIL